MTNGRRWLAIDADMFGKPFTLDLHHQFGPVGVAVWVAFLCGCKRNRIPGRVSFISEADARAQLGIHDWDLVDNEGKPWALEDFWLYTGRKKQTRRTRRGRETNVIATHWERWQQTAQRAREAERMRGSRAQNRSESVRTSANTGRTNVRSYRDRDSDTPQPPKGADALRAETANPVALATALKEIGIVRQGLKK